MDTKGTHFPVLAACVARTSGPVLELGCGDYSTPLLHLLCNGRPLVSMDHDSTWLYRYKDLETPWHTFRLVKDWAAEKIIDETEWGVAFVDHAPAQRRVHEIRRLKERAEYIVVHDTEDPAGIYNYAALLPEFKFRYDCKRWPTWTSVVSMSRSFEPTALPHKSVDVMVIAHNRAEYTRECLYHLIRNTTWELVRKLTVYDVGSEDGAGSVARDMLSSFDKAALEIVNTPKTTVLEVQNFHVKKVQASFMAKIDNDIAVPRQWLDVALSVCIRHPEVGILGLSPMMGFTQKIIPVEAFGYRRAPVVGGVFLARASVFQEALSLPHSLDCYFGFQDWQERAIPSVVKGWIVPGIHVVLMDMVPFEPWAGLRKKYIERGWQRKGGIYTPDNPVLWWWRYNHAPNPS